MLSLHSILNQYALSQVELEELVLLLPTCSFIKILSPLLKYAALEIKFHLSTLPHYSEQNNLHLFFWNEEDLKKTIYTYLGHQLHLQSSRIFVFELNMARQSGLLKGNTPEKRFNDFLNLMCQEKNRIDFFQKYVLLEKLWLRTLEQYLRSIKEMLSRLYADYSELKEKWLDAQCHWQLTNVNIIGDLHKQGRAVSSLHFKTEEGKERIIIYKPRSVAIDAAYQQFIVWINQLSQSECSTPLLKLYKTEALYKEHYGWFEYIAYSACQNKSQVCRYYERLGYLLAFIYLLKGTDIHFENMIALGEYPVLIDTECLMLPEINLSPDGQTKFFVKPLVIDTHLLPRKIGTDNEMAEMDMSAFSGTGGQLTPQKGLKEINPGTDFMTIERQDFFLKAMQNIPKIAEKNIEPVDYKDHFIKGFVKMYRFFLNQKTLLLSKASPLQAFRGKMVRLVLRNTADYAKLLFESYHPVLLHDLKARKQHFSWLDSKSSLSPLKTIVISEIRDLMEENIPIFTAFSDGTEVLDSLDKHVDLKILKTGFDSVMNHLKENFNEQDLNIQQLCIEQSLLAHQLNLSDAPIPKKISRSSKVKVIDLKCISLEIAKMELDKLMRYKIQTNNELTWTAMDYINGKTWQAERIGLSLYNGLAGIILAFAYAGKVFKSNDYYEIAKSGWNYLKKRISLNESILSNLGAFSGIGGLIYTAHCLFLLWEDHEMLDFISKQVALAPSLINKKTQFDMIDGVMGYLAILMHCSSSIEKSVVQAQARLCIEHLFHYYPIPNELPQIEFTVPISQPLTGFSHGTTGILWALNQYLTEYTDDAQSIQIWIQRALNYERSVFCPKEKNWPDYRRKDIRYISTWCHGATGIGIARIDMYKKAYSDHHLKNEIKQAIDTTAGQLHGEFNLCHGDCGSLELMLNAYQQNLISNLFFHQQVSKIVNAIQSNQKLVYEGKISDTFSPGLLTGAAGVAYQFLRLAYPEQVPSVLLLESPCKVKDAHANFNY